MGDKAGFKAAQLIRSADEQAVHRAHPSSLFVGREYLHERVANDDADVVGGSTEEESGPGEPEVPRKAEEDGGDSKACDRPEQRTAGSF